ncbi:MAG: phosphoribosyltransferase family protein [Patescibacteria group bacterium]
MFKDRTEAGKALAMTLLKYSGEDVVVLALPRGGVVLGYEVAKAIKAPLDIIPVRKIGLPGNPEYAVGVVDEKGTLLLNEGEAESIDKKWLANEIEKEKKEALRRSLAYRGNSPLINLKNKIVILTDDGIATGFSMRLAVKRVMKDHPKKVVVAVPVAPAESIRELERDGVDEIIVLEPPEEFKGAVGSHYRAFEQVTDAEVLGLLAESFI